MANEVTFIVKVEGKNVSIVQKQTDKLAKSTEKVDKAQKKATQSGNKYHKLQKGVGQMGANNTKNFSKMNQTMGGSSGLVAAYATLAANVFAATAAFGALQRAAEFENLKKGLHELGQQSGRTLSILAKGLRDVTGGALSAEESMRGAAIGISGGFGGAELEGLAKIAKGAAITLGRNLPDAFDRLTRGAIKLEPEILDELGIMVRVDEAAENYAATIGKTANSLTMMEKRQAFMNAILEQGESKFGEIAEAVDPDPYTKLGATFADLTNEIFSFINETLMLGNVAEFLSENVTILAGVMVLFGSTIAAKMLPFLADGAAAAHAQAEKMALLAEATTEAAAAQKAAAIGRLGAGGPDVLSKGYLKSVEALKENGAEMKDIQALQRSINGQLGHYSSKIKMGKAISSTANKQKLVGLELEKQQLAQLILMEKGRTAEVLKRQMLDASSIFAKTAANAISSYTAGVATLGQAFKGINAGFGKYVENVNAAKTAQLAHGVELGRSAKFMTYFGATTKWVGKQFRLLGAAIMKSIVPIAIIVITIGAIVALWDILWNTKEQKKYNEGMEDLDLLLSEIEEKVQKMNKAMNNTKDLADGQNRAFEIQSGILTELAAKMKDLIKLRKEASATRPGEDEDDVQGMGWLGRKSKMLDEWLNLPTPGVAKFKKATGTTGDEAGFEGLISLHDSPEIKAMLGILTSEIPGAAKLMDKKLRNILKDTFKSNEISAKQYARAVREVEAAYANLGPASSGLRESFKELEKESSKFLSTFAKKTSVDSMVRAFEATDKAFEEFINTVKNDASLEHWAETVGIAMLDIGSKTASILGPEFVNAQKQVREVTTEVDKLAIKTGKTLEQLRDAEHDLVIDLDTALKNLKSHDKAYQHISAEVKQIQRMEMVRKDIIDAINKAMKFMNKNYKMSVDLAGKQNKLLKQRLMMEEELARSKHNLLKNRVKEIKVIEQITESGEDDDGMMWFKVTKELKEQYTIAEFLKLSYVEQNKLLEHTKLSQDQLNALRMGEYNLALKVLEITNVTDSQTFSKNKEKAEALLYEIELEGKLLKGLIKRQETEQKISNFRTRGTTDMDAGDKAKQAVNAALQEYNFAKDKAEQEKKIIEAKAEMLKLEFDLLNGQILLSNKMTRNILDEDRASRDLGVMSDTEWEASGHKVEGFNKETLENMKTALDTITNLQTNAVDQNVNQLAANVQLAVYDGLLNITEAIKNDDIDLGKAIRDQIILKDTVIPVRFKLDETGAVTGEKEDDKGDKKSGEAQSRMTIASGIMSEFKNQLTEISEEGGGMAQFIGGMDMMAQSMVNLKEGGDKIEGIKGILAGVGEAMAGASRAAVAQIDDQIKAEEKRDGKSKESLAKIRALEMKKYQMQKKAFEQNKKIQLANAIVNGMAAIQSGFATEPFLYLGLAMGAMATVMTMMQIKAIKNTTFGGSPPEMGAKAPGTALSIGKRSSNIDVSRGATGGELGYLRGQRGYGTSAANWKPTGGAAGLRRGYAYGGDILVGETGPEVLTADEMGYHVIPNNRLGGGASNVSFTINAVDAAGVEDVLLRQRGNIIGMIRQAANDTGERFLESVDTDVVGGG